MSKEKAFIILTPGFPSSEKDTTCLPMQQQFIRSMYAHHPDVEIIILSFQYPYHRQTYRWFHTTVISFNGRNKGGIQRLFLRRKVNRVLEKIHQHKQIVGLLSFWLNECAAVGKYFAKKKGIPHYCWLLGQDAREQNKYPARLQVHGGELVALSEFLQAEFEKNHGIRPLHVVPPGITNQNYLNTQRDIDLLAVGSLISLKQFQIFIELVARLRQEFPFIKAMLVGEGPEKETLQHLIIDAGVQEQVFMTGMLGHDEVLRLMQRSKILVHPSSYEGFSGVCLEALSSGSHVISFCRAMKNDIPNWHIAATKEDMIQKSLEILATPALKHEPVIVHSMEETVRRMMKLYQEA